MSDVDCTVVGAGVVGLAIARALARAGHDVIVVEREPALGTGVSSRNSEVLHAGLYYPTGSLKAALCLRGNALAYDYCASRGIAHRRCGKLVVAADETERAALERIAERASANGVQGARLIEQGEVQALEPALRCVAALHVPSSGIVDSHALMLALLADAESHGATLAVASPFAGATPHGDGWQLRTAGDDAFTMSTRWLINAAGLGAQRVARSIEGLPAAWVPQAHFAKGHYFSLAGRSPFSRLIYPIPVDGGLGVHLTIDLAGQAKFGPDVEWLGMADEAAIDYRVQPARAAAFEADIRRWWPALPADALAPAYSGVRPKISGPGEPAADFRIDGPAAHGLAGLVNLFGIESPGLTAALALGEHVAAMVR